MQKLLLAYEKNNKLVTITVQGCKLLVYYPGCFKQYSYGITTCCRSALGAPDADFCRRCEPADLVQALEMFYTHMRGQPC
jgi:hypothetical protein